MADLERVKKVKNCVCLVQIECQHRYTGMAKKCWQSSKIEMIKVVQSNATRRGESWMQLNRSGSKKYRNFYEKMLSEMNGRVDTHTQTKFAYDEESEEEEENYSIYS